jgi:hypothetical protein
MGPAVMAAIINPNKLAAKTGPKVRSGIPRVSAIDGARNPMHCVSKPSRTSTRLQKTIVEI